MGEVAISILMINVSLEDHQTEYQPMMIELEGKIANHVVFILISPGARLIYIIPKVVDLWSVKTNKFKNP